MRGGFDCLICWGTLNSFTFRVGSRIYNKVDVQTPEMCLASTLLSLSKFGTFQTQLGEDIV